jgi:hypothetical protein
MHLCCSYEGIFVVVVVGHHQFLTVDIYLANVNNALEAVVKITEKFR